MRGRRAICHVTKRVAQRGQLVDLPVDRICFLMKNVARKVRLTIHAKHAGNLVKREPRRFAHRNQFEL